MMWLWLWFWYFWLWLLFQNSCGCWSCHVISHLVNLVVVCRVGCHLWDVLFVPPHDTPPPPRLLGVPAPPAPPPLRWLPLELWFPPLLAPPLRLPLEMLFVPLPPPPPPLLPPPPPPLVAGNPDPVCCCQGAQRLGQEFGFQAHCHCAAV